MAIFNIKIDYFMILKIYTKNEFFLVSRIFSINFDFKNVFKTEFKDSYEKSCRLCKNRVSHKINFKAVWPRNGHAASMRLKFIDLRLQFLAF